MEHVIVDAILAASAHDDTAAIDAQTLRYEDIDSPNESVALEILFRNRLTWHDWTLVVDALQKVFKGDYVYCLFDVMLNVRGARTEFMGIGSLYNPSHAQTGTARRSWDIELA